MRKVQMTMNYQPGYDQAWVRNPQPDRQNANTTNVGENERRLSLLSGFGLVLLGLRLGGPRGLAALLLGGHMIYRGATGYCFVYNALGRNTAVGKLSGSVSVPHEQGIRVREQVVINRPVEEVYTFWRNFENLPRFMDNLEKVEVFDAKNSRWTVKAPLGASVSWDAEIINERPNELIAWRSKENADVSNAGSVTFRPTFNNQATELEVKLEYVPPAGDVGAFVARVLGREPRQQVPEDMQRLKQLLEREGQQTASDEPESIDAFSARVTNGRGFSNDPNTL
jgi:uncharacterized membrane protein